jgi:hypothetical protein
VDQKGLARNASLAVAAVPDTDKLAIGRGLAQTHQMNVAEPSSDKEVPPWSITTPDPLPVAKRTLTAVRATRGSGPCRFPFAHAVALDPNVNRFWQDSGESVTDVGIPKLFVT